MSAVGDIVLTKIQHFWETDPQATECQSADNQTIVMFPMIIESSFLIHLLYIDEIILKAC